MTGRRLFTAADLPPYLRDFDAGSWPGETYGARRAAWSRARTAWAAAHRIPLSVVEVDQERAGVGDLWPEVVAALPDDPDDDEDGAA